jgi:aryl-alcohol dehydrogenase-like predicted oxidoreductase
MGALHRAGKIRAIGVSNFSPAQMDEFRKVASLHTAQPPYNLFERAIDEDVLPYCRGNKIAVLAYGSPCRGLYRKPTGEPDRRIGEANVVSF